MMTLGLIQQVRSGSAEKVAKTVPVYYGADDEIDTRDSKDDVPLLHPEFALWRQKHVNYVKRSKRLTVGMAINYSVT